MKTQIWRSAVAWIGSTFSEKESSSLQIEAEYFLETLAQFFQPPKHRIPQDRNLSVRRHESLKSNRWFIF
jgi:hypothetical protein